MKESIEARLTRLEDLFKLLHQELECARQAYTGHQMAIEALASLAGVKIEKQPARQAPLSTNN